MNAELNFYVPMMLIFAAMFWLNEVHFKEDNEVPQPLTVTVEMRSLDSSHGAR